ncbi:MAG: dihydrolipoyl dehydrogenase [Planctomycetes bacterium]|nr:dihydrolipoyl dehydrogenase [Planctomycetota bacterium]
MKSFDAVVIGAGPGGYVAAIRLGQLGVKTAIIERENVGGVCLNWGCIPSKAYIQAAKLFEGIHGAAEVGITVAAPAIDLKKTRAWKDSIVQRLTGGVSMLLQKAGVEIIKGQARFTGPTSLVVEGAEGKQEIGFRNAMIATGSRSLEIPPFPYDGKDVISSTEALDLDAVPKHLCVIGGGVIGLEIGMYLNAFGAEVTVVEMMDQVLPGVDAEVVKTLGRVLKKRKIKVHTSTKALGYSGKGGKLEVEIEDQKGKRSKIACDKILVSVGRRPNSENLGLDQAGVQTDKRGFIPVDQQLRTNVANIFAIGDVAGGMLLAHKASKEGLVAAAVIAGKNEIYDVRAMPGAIFTEPEVATVGLSEEQARAAGHEVAVGRFPFTALGKSLAARDTEGFVKIVSDKKTDLVLGVHIIGAHASDLISEAALAIEMGATVEDIALTVHPHPTLGESLMEAAEAVHGMAVHILNPK